MYEENYWKRLLDHPQSRRRLLGRLAAVSAGSAALLAAACGGNKSGAGAPSSGNTTPGQKYPDPGISDKEIKIGDTSSYSGPVAANGLAIQQGVKAYFQYVNEEQGGVNGRKITYLSSDDGYDPAKALANVRRSVEQDGVFAIANDLGTPGAEAVLPYLTPKGIPFLMPGTSLNMFGDPQKYPSVIIAGPSPSYYAFAVILGQYVAKQFAGQKIGTLSQSGDPGPDFVNGFKAGLGDAAKNIVANETILPTAPTADAQVERLKTSGATVWLNASTPAPAVLALKSAFQLGWHPQIFVGSINNDPHSVLAAAGADATKGTITGLCYKGPAPSDPQWKDDKDMVTYRKIVTKYQPQTDLQNLAAVSGYESAKTIVESLKRMKTPTRKGLIDAFRSLKNYSTGVELPGITLNGSDKSNFLLNQVQLARFDGQRWVTFGGVLSAK